MHLSSSTGVVIPPHHTPVILIMQKIRYWTWTFWTHAKHEEDIKTGVDSTSEPSNTWKQVFHSVLFYGRVEWCIKQGALIMMDAFFKHLDLLQQAIMDSEYWASPGQMCRCGDGQALYYCGDCFLSPLYCRSCVLAAHSRTPFHQIQEWSGSYFRRTSLSKLGLLLTLGCDAGLCPNCSSSSKPRNVTIIHTNGIHNYQIKFCHCADTSSVLVQLMRSHLFPTTVQRPETLFMFSVLDNFHMLSLTSKIPAYDYWDTLVNLTDHVFPQNTRTLEISGRQHCYTWRRVLASTESN